MKATMRALILLAMLTLYSGSWQTWATDPFYLVKDVNISGNTFSSNPNDLTEVNGTVFFAATDSVNGTELWKSDGTTAGTMLVKDINAGTGSSSPANLTNVNGTLYFTATTAANGTELWKSDGTTAGTVMVKDIYSGSNGSNPVNLTNINGVLYFAAATSAAGNELWKSDGTDAGTVQVKDIYAGTGSSNPAWLVNLNGVVYFAAATSANGTELWKSDGTSAGTTLVKDIWSGSNGSSPAYLTVYNGALYFSACDGTGGTADGIELWKSDGTTAGTVMLKNIRSGKDSSSPSYLTVCNNLLFFSASESTNGVELWKSDGTAAGTVIVKNLNSGDSNPNNLTVVGNTLFFSADTDASGIELCKSDGTSAGTVVVKDIYAGSTDSNPANLTNVNGTLFFTAADATNGTELWKSDGTAAGTVLIKDIYAGATTSGAASLVKLNNMVCFAASDGIHGAELWKSDGTTAGTVMTKDIQPGSNDATPTNLEYVGNTLFFAANDPLASGTELWKSDGTDAGTTLVADIYAGTNSSNPGNLTGMNGALYFTATTSANGTELWKSDGTAVGTALLKDIYAGSNSSNPSNLIVFEGDLYFAATTSAGGTELWKSDGTAAGTAQLKDIYSGSGSSNPGNFVIYLNQLYFTATTSANGTELWKTDGTTAGTVMIKDIRSGSNSSSPSGLVVGYDGVYFSANDGTAGAELWKTDGTLAGTVLVKDVYSGSSSSSPANLTRMGNTIYFTATTSSNGTELWKSDGTAAGTVLVKDIYSGSTSSAPSSLFIFNGTLYFAATTSASGTELWKSDGTALGTVMVKEIAAGSASSTPGNFTVINNTLIFTANDAINGVELWRTDGTSAGTVLLKDLCPGSNGSNPLYMTLAGSRLFFQADDGVYGTELWAMNIVASPTMTAEPAWTAGTSNSVAWTGDSNAVSYLVQCSTTADFASLVASGNETAPTQTHTFSGLANGQLYYYRVCATDADGLVSPWSSSTSSTQDTTLPSGSLVINGGAGYTNTTQVTLTLAATDSGSGLAQMRLSNDGSTWNDWEAFAASKSWGLASGEGAKTVHVQYRDTVGNVSTGDIAATITLDTVRPTVAMNSSAASTTNLSPISVSVTFSSSVSGFASSHIVAGNANVSNFAGSGASYSFDLAPLGAGLVTANIAADVAQNIAGNGNTAATQFSRTYVTPVQNVTRGVRFGTLAAAVSTATAGDSLVVDPWTFSEAVSINVPLNLRSSAGAATTIIQGGLRLTSNNIHVEGFTIATGHDFGRGPAAIQIDGNTSLSLTANVLTGPGSLGSGIVLAKDSSKVTILGSDIHGWNRGIEVTTSTIVTISQNQIHGNNSGIWSQGLNFSTITSNQFTSNLVAGWQSLNTGSNFSAELNSFTGNGAGILSDGPVANARNNWWGDASGPSGGAADPVTGVLAAGASELVGTGVRFDPWLIGPNPTITVTAPTAGASWAKATTQTIRWTTSQLAGNVKIFASIDGGAWNQIANNIANSGSFNWLVNLGSSSRVKIRVTSMQCNSIYGESELFSIITPASITVQAPVTGASWTKGTTQAVRWSSTGISGNVKVFASVDGGAWNQIAYDVPNAGSCNWLVNLSPSTQAKIRVTSMANNALYGESGFFTITGNVSIAVQAPVTGATWTKGTTQTIQWSSTGLTGNVKVFVAVDGGGWSQIANDIPNSGSFAWLIKAGPSTQAKIRVTSMTNNALYGESGFFTIN